MGARAGAGGRRKVRALPRADPTPPQARIQPLLCRDRQLPVGGSEQLVHVVRQLGAEDRGAERRVGQQPCHRHLRRGTLLLPRHGAERGAERCGDPQHLRRVRVRRPVVGGRQPRPVAHLAGQQAHRQRAVGDQSEPEAPAQRSDLLLDQPALHQAVGVLQHRGPVQPECVRDPQQLHQLGGVVVAHPDVARLARRHHVVQRQEALLQRCLGIRHVHEIHVQVVGLQAAQAALDLRHDVAPRQAAPVGSLPHRLPHFAGEHQSLTDPEPPHQAAHQFLGFAEAVEVGAVDEVAAQLDGALEGGHALPLAAYAAAQAAERGTQAQRRHLHPGGSQRTILHGYANGSRATFCSARHCSYSRRPCSFSG